MHKPNAALERIDRANRAETDNTQERVAELAYQLWQSRGCPEGSSEDDWLRAEQQVSSKKNERRSAA